MNHIPGIHDNGPRGYELWRRTLTAYNKAPDGVDENDDADKMCGENRKNEDEEGEWNAAAAAAADDDSDYNISFKSWL